MNNLKEFFTKFFKNLNCKIIEEENSLVISEIPSRFEKFSGKKGPYYLSFEEKTGYEKITSNHYLIKAIKEFLENQGETTLLKIDRNPDFKEIIPKKIPFLNSSIKSITPSKNNQIITKFTFATTFQYLNEKEQNITPIYIQENQIINFDENIPLIEGSKREIKEIDLKQEHEKAKEKLKDITKIKIIELSEKLNNLLKQEIQRIKDHYENDLKEFITQKENLERQIANQEDPEKTKKLKKTLENLKDDKNIEKIKQEEQTFIEHETKKHGLNVSNKLRSVAIIYYPIYKLNLILDLGNKNYKMLELFYDSLKEKILPLNCQNCNSELKEIILCSSGHLICRNCGERCKNCNEIYCEKCNLKKCEKCEKTICPSCITTCNKCRKNFCKEHINQIDNNKKLCYDCIKICSECRSLVDPELTTKIEGKTYCLKCSTRITKKDIMKELKK